jgi:hypothetical protein
LMHAGIQGLRVGEAHAGGTHVFFDWIVDCMSVSLQNCVCG